MFNRSNKKFTRPDELTRAVDVRYEKNELVIEHIEDAEAGIQSLHFPERGGDFGEVLESHGLDPRDYIKIEAPNVPLGVVFLWANRDVLLVTNTHPMESSHPDRGDIRTWGYAQFVGIEGREDEVSSLYDDLLEKSTRYAFSNASERQWL